MFRRTRVRKAVLIDDSDLEEILSDYFNVPETNVMKTREGYTIAFEDDRTDRKEGDRNE